MNNRQRFLMARGMTRTATPLTWRDGFDKVAGKILRGIILTALLVTAFWFLVPIYLIAWAFYVGITKGNRR